jgi:two-component system cell cycle sensor histidine kinase/response regulator CckA
MDVLRRLEMDRPFRFLFLILPLIVLLGWEACPAFGSATEPFVTSLTSYHQGYAWSDEGLTGLLDRLRRNVHLIDPPIEHLIARKAISGGSAIADRPESIFDRYRVPVTGGLLLMAFLLLLIIGLTATILRRRRIEEALRRSEERFRELYDYAPVGYHEYDVNGIITNVNRTDLEMLGYTREEMVGRPMWDFNANPEEARERILAKLKEREPPGRNHQLIYVRKDGTTIMVLAEDRLFRDREGRVTGLRTTIQDITERRRAEDVLRRYELLSKDARDIILIVQRDGRILEANEAAVRAYGYTPEELLTLTVYDLRPGEMASEVRAQLERAGAEGVLFEAVHRRKDGSVFPVEVSSRSALIGGETVLMSIVRDISQRKGAEDRIMRLNRLYRVLSRINHVIARLHDREELFREVCRIAVEDGNFVLAWVGIADAESGALRPVASDGTASGYINEGRFSVRDEPEGRGPAGTAVRTGAASYSNDIATDPKMLPWRDAALRHGFGSTGAIPIRLNGRIIGMFIAYAAETHFFNEEEVKLLEEIGRNLSLALDVMEQEAQRKQAEQEKAALEEQLLQAQKMEAVGRLAGGVAHDFNNLLMVIQGYSEMTLLEIKEGDPIRAGLEEIHRAGERAADLTRQLLAFSRRQVLELRVIDLNTLVQNLGKMLRRMIGEDIQMVTVLAGDLGRVKADPGQMEQALINLAINARDAMPDGGTLTLATANVELDEARAKSHVGGSAGSYVMLSMSDTGSGMAPEIRERIFEPFFTTKERGKGTGLGLSMVYGIVRQSGGAIWAESEPGRGTTFRILLPKVDAPEETVEERPGRKVLPRGDETILVVEDAAEVRHLVVQVLEMQGYRVLAASHGEEALQVAGRHEVPIALMVTDVVMPGMSGKGLADRIVLSRPAMKVLYMSGYTDEAIVHHGILNEGLNYIQKPFAVESLVIKVREVLDGERKG